MQFNSYKNALIYNLMEMPEHLVRLDKLQNDLSHRRHLPIASSDSSSRGFTHPFLNQDDDALFVRVDQFIYLAYVNEEKDVDRDTINARTDEAIAKAEDEGREVNQELKTSLYDQFERELMPYFKVKRKIVHAYVDMKRNVLVVNTNNTNLAESFISYLRTTLGTFRVTLMGFGHKPCHYLSNLIQEKEQPDGLCFYDDGKLVAKNPPGKGVEKQNVTIEGFDAEDENVISVLCGLNVVSADMYATFVMNNDSTLMLGFTLKSVPDASKSNPDAILSKLRLGMEKRYFKEDVNGAAFENGTYIGIIIDALVNGFGGCENTDYLDGEFGVHDDDVKKIFEILSVSAEADTISGDTVASDIKPSKDGTVWLSDVVKKDNSLVGSLGYNSDAA